MYLAQSVDYWCLLVMAKTIHSRSTKVLTNIHRKYFFHWDALLALGRRQVR